MTLHYSLETTTSLVSQSHKLEVFNMCLFTRLGNKKENCPERKNKYINNLSVQPLGLFSSLYFTLLWSRESKRIPGCTCSHLCYVKTGLWTSCSQVLMPTGYSCSFANGHLFLPLADLYSPNPTLRTIGTGHLLEIGEGLFFRLTFL